MKRNSLFVVGIILVTILACNTLAKPNAQHITKPDITPGRPHILNMTPYTPTASSKALLPTAKPTTDSQCNAEIVITGVDKVDLGEGSKIILVRLAIKNTGSLWGKLQGPDDDWFSLGTPSPTYLTTTDGSKYEYVIGQVPVSSEDPTYMEATGFIQTRFLPPSSSTLGMFGQDKQYYYKLAFSIPSAKVPKSVTIDTMNYTCIVKNATDSNSGVTGPGNLPAKTYDLITDLTKVDSVLSESKYPNLVGSKLDLPYSGGSLEFIGASRDKSTVSITVKFTNLSSDTNGPTFDGYVIGDSLLETCANLATSICSQFQYNTVDSVAEPGQTKTFTWVFEVPESDKNLLFIYNYDDFIDVNKVYKINLTNVSATSNEKSLCKNDYYPVVKGAQWIYKVTDNNSGVLTQAKSLDEILEVRQEEFDDIQETVGYASEFVPPATLAADIHFTWKCSSDGLVSPFADGIWLPNKMDINSEWKNTYSGVNQTCTVIATEKVNVPAGTFDTMKVNCVLAGAESVNMYYWYAKGVGKIKMSTEDSNSNTSHLEELISYTIPTQ